MFKVGSLVRAEFSDGHQYRFAIILKIHETVDGNPVNFLYTCLNPLNNKKFTFFAHELTLLS